MTTPRRARIQRLARRKRSVVIVVRLAPMGGDGPAGAPILIGGTAAQREAVRAQLAAEASDPQPAPAAPHRGGALVLST
jgi:hypothetical protein